jgi:glycosyltransferase involved in cell wall biosynthesis
MTRKQKSNNLKERTVYTAYVPHGVSEKFRPITIESDEYSKVIDMKVKLGIGDKRFILLYNNRNIRRKNPGDVILAYKEFCDGLPDNQSAECVLLMHTSEVDMNGTDLPEVVKNICPDYDVVFTKTQFSTDDLNVLYNLADVTINMASNEGFGLATCESIKAGTPIIVNVTGGLQDQCGFTKNGKFLTAEDYIELGSLHDVKKLPHNLSWGSWVNPIWPTNRSLQGSPMTPYIFDDRCSYEDAAKAIRQWYDTPLERRLECGLEGSEFANSEQSGMSARYMGERFVDVMDYVFDNWKVKEDIVIWKI